MRVQTTIPLLFRTCLFVLSACLFYAIAAADEIGFVEDFALTDDRQASLKQLVPGTEEAYYFQCLHFLNTERFDAIQPLLVDWIKRHGETMRVWEIRNRHALLTYNANPQASLDYLKGHLGLTYSHQREQLDAEPQLPTSLDGQLIAREAWIARAQTHSPGTLEAYEDSAMDWLVAQPLNPEIRRQLLARLTRPDYPQLVKLISDDLSHLNSGGFGSLGIHRLLLSSQLDELVTLRPEVCNEQPFVTAYLHKLQPSLDIDWRSDDQEHAAYLRRQRIFSDRLGPVHNTLKAHVRYHQLALSQRQGKFEKAEFIDYLRLPRAVGYLSKEMRESNEAKTFACNLGSNYEGASLFPPIHTDEPLVRSYLSQFLLEAADTKEFEPFIQSDYLKNLFAEVKLVNGLGDNERFVSMLQPEQFKALKDRVDLDFMPSNATVFEADAEVGLDVAIKNVQTLFIKIFEINTKSHYRIHLSEINTDITLDGLTPNIELSIAYEDDPLRRVVRHFNFPQLSKPGIYVVDFIGNGRSSRAILRKGRLKQLVHAGPAGQVFTIFNDSGAVIKDATLWLSGQEYQSAEDGLITVPYSTSPGRQPIVISAPWKGKDQPVAGLKTEYSSLEYFDHLSEAYSLVVGFHVDRESLKTRSTAEVIVRPLLAMNGVPVSIKSLTDVKLTIESLDLDGVSTMQEVPNIELFEDREKTHEFLVPQRLSKLTFSLDGRVVNSSAGGPPTNLRATQSFSMNEIDRTEKVEDLHLVRSGESYGIEMRGKNGEKRPSRPVSASLKSRDFRHPFSVTLKTDLQGRIDFGTLFNIEAITVTGPEGTSHTWPMLTDQATYQKLVHGRVGQSIRIPFIGMLTDRTGLAPEEKPSRAEVSFLELRGENYAADQFDALSIQEGFLVIDGLSAGDYELFMKVPKARMRVRVTLGKEQGRYFLGKHRQLERRLLEPPGIESITVQKKVKIQVSKVGETPDPTDKPKKNRRNKKADENDEKIAEEVVVQLRAISPYTRVHLVATRMVPEYDMFATLSRVRSSEPWLFSQNANASVYVTGRNIGDEYAYIFQRRYGKKFPGNMLERPALLLNPWVVEETHSSKQTAQQGNEFGAAAAMPTSMADASMAQPATVEGPPANFANLDFLASGSIVLANSEPSEDGTIRIPLESLAQHQHLTVVVVDPLSTFSRSFALPARELALDDLCLKKGLDPQQHFTQQKKISMSDVGKPFILSDIAASRFEVYDSLSKVYGLFSTLSGDPSLAQFEFLMRWPKLDTVEKKVLYSKYACHELNFFLSRKDIPFFQNVVFPSLLNKKDKTFLDRYLLGEDLTLFVESWKYAQLNTFEQVLLSERIEGEISHTLRHVEDRLAMIPENIDRMIHLFDTAVRGSALNTSDTFGLLAGASNGVGNFRGGMGGEMPPERELLQSEKLGEASGRFQEPASGKKSERDRIDMSDRLARDNRSDEQDGSMALGKRAEQRNAGSELRRSLSLSRKAGGSVDKAKAENASEKQKEQALFFETKNSSDSVRQLYREIEQTKEWAENNYYHLSRAEQSAERVKVGAFWRDYAKRDRNVPFQSSNLATASSNFSEMILALAVLDLPFESPQHKTEFAEGQMTLDPAGPMVIFHEEIKVSDVQKKPEGILVSQNFFRHSDRQSLVNGKPVDKFVTDEFLTHAVYGCQVVVTNPTSARQDISLLLQIPTGAVPVLTSQQTRTEHVSLEPYHTKSIEYHFYFPVAGRFSHYPVHVAKNEKIVAMVDSVELNVVEKPTKLDIQSWDYVSQNGTDEEVIQFIDAHNVKEIQFDRIAWRMREPEMFLSVTSRLARRHTYSDTLWSYSIFHNQPEAIREYLQHSDSFVLQCGGRLSSDLVSIDPVVRGTFEHLEYKPLANARAHSLGLRRQIVNDRFHAQYHDFLSQLCRTRSLSNDDRLAVVYYLLLQDRVEESLAMFSRVRPEEVTTKLQYDYCNAYLHFFSDQHAQARAIALRYVDYPVDRWRNVFAAIILTLDEAAGNEMNNADPHDRTQQQANLAASSPSIEFKIDSEEIVLEHRNLENVVVHFYEMDVELLFSRNPFAGTFGGQFSSIQPNQSLSVDLAPDQRTDRIPLPKEFRNKNILVEVTGGGLSRSVAYYSSSLLVQGIENYGQIKVTQQKTGLPISKAYVKVYAKMDSGDIKFYKDGYTDHRGRFDYATLSTDDLDSANKFSILVLSETDGASVREALPPIR